MVQGQQLILPQGVVRNTNNASSFAPYDPAQAIGDVSPTAPTPPKNDKGCGTFGKILLAIIAIAVTVIALPTGVAPTILQGALAGLAGGAASQVVGVATGVQQKFDFKGLALSALGGAVGAGLGPGGGIFGKTGLFGQTVPNAATGIGTVFEKGSLGIASATLSSAASSAVGSAITQGVGVATGLQSKFSWAGVAAAGVAASVGHVTGKAIGVKSFAETRSLANVGAHTLHGGARLIANAATRSAIDGSSFGDNVMAALPDTLAQTIGGLISAEMAGPSNARQNKQFLQSLGLPSEEIQEVLTAIGSINPDHLRSITNAGGGPTNDEVAHFLVNQLESWEAELAIGARTGVSNSDFKAFKRRIAFHLIAADAYKLDGGEHILPSGYGRIAQSQLDQWGLTADLLVDVQSGFSSSVYFDPEGSAIVAFRGTEPTDFGDIVTDIKQHTGLRAAQYEYLARNLDTITTRLSSVIGPRISFTGHSLGGGLATFAGLRTGLQTFAIAPAPLHQKTLNRYGITESMISSSNIQYAAVLGEPLQGIGRNWAERSNKSGYISNMTLGNLEGKTFFFGNHLKSYPASLGKDGVVSPEYLLRFNSATSHSVIHNGLSSFYTGATELGLGTSLWFWDWNIYGD